MCDCIGTKVGEKKLSIEQYSHDDAVLLHTIPKKKYDYAWLSAILFFFFIPFSILLNVPFAYSEILKWLLVILDKRIIKDARRELEYFNFVIFCKRVLIFC